MIHVASYLAPLDQPASPPDRGCGKYHCQLAGCECEPSEDDDENYTIYDLSDRLEKLERILRTKTVKK